MIKKRVEERVKKDSCEDSCNSCESTCVNSNAKAIWAIGITVVILVLIVSIALSKGEKHNSTTQKLRNQPVAWTQTHTQFTCPFCQSLFQVPYAALGESLQCPHCLGQIATGNNVNNTGPAMSQVMFFLRGQGQGQGRTAGSQTHIPPPTIFRDAVMPHEYRGVCSNCHVIKAAIPIPSSALMPHEYRGVCSNCHVIIKPAGVR